MSPHKSLTRSPVLPLGAHPSWPPALFGMADQMGRAVALGVLDFATAGEALRVAAWRYFDGLLGGIGRHDGAPMGLEVQLAWRLRDAVRHTAIARRRCMQVIRQATEATAAHLGSAALLAQAETISAEDGRLLWPHEQREIVAAVLRSHYKSRGRV